MKSEFDWVSKRAVCSPSRVFREICQGIENDVARINSVKNIPKGELFATETTSDGGTIAIGQPNVAPRKRALITVNDSSIRVHSDGVEKDWEARVCMTDDGLCVLRLDDGTEIEQWQFRKRALEVLFFDIESCSAPAATKSNPDPIKAGDSKTQQKSR